MPTRDVIRSLESYKRDAGESDFLKDMIILEPLHAKIRFYVSDPDIEGGDILTVSWVPRSTEKEEVAQEPKPKQTNTMQPKSESLTHEKPAHYADMKIDVIEFCQKNNLDFMQGNIIKYVCRFREKGGEADLLKAREYIDRLIMYENESREINGYSKK